MAALLGSQVQAAPQIEAPRVAELALSNFLATVVNFLSTPATADFEQELQDTFDKLRPTLLHADPLLVAKPNQKHT